MKKYKYRIVTNEEREFRADVCLVKKTFIEFLKSQDTFIETRTNIMYWVIVIATFPFIYFDWLFSVKLGEEQWYNLHWYMNRRTSEIISETRYGKYWYKKNEEVNELISEHKRKNAETKEKFEQIIYEE